MLSSAQIKALEANIWKLYLIRISKWFMVFMPIVVLFYQSTGLNLREVMTINAIYSIAVAVFEIPSGYFSDQLGRKRTIIIGTILITIQFAFYSQSYSMWGFGTGAVIGGLGASFISGTDSAMLFDSLVALERKGDYLRWEGRTYAIGTFAEAVAAIVGGWLAYYFSLRMPMNVQVGISFLGVLTALTLTEPPVYKKTERSNWEQVRYIINFAFLKNKTLRLYIAYATLFGLASLLLAWFAQPYFEYNQIEEDKIGYLWALLSITVAVFSMQAHFFNHFFSEKALVALILLGMSVGYLLIAFAGNQFLWLGLAAMFGMYALRGIAAPTVLNLINQQTESDMRATVLSIRGFVVRVFYALLAPLLGWVADVFTILEAFTYIGIGLALFSGIALFFQSMLSK